MITTHNFHRILISKQVVENYKTGVGDPGMEKIMDNMKTERCKKFYFIRDLSNNSYLINIYRE
jgi:hypothetical protein